MDRSLNGDDFRILEQAAGGTTRPTPPSPPTLDQLPAWFRRLAIQQAQELGITLPPESGVRRAA